MCDSIRFLNEPDVQTVRQFQKRFTVDAKGYGFDGKEEFLDCCMCGLDLEQFFKDHPEHKFYYDCGEWWEGEPENLTNA